LYRLFRRDRNVASNADAEGVVAFLGCELDLAAEQDVARRGRKGAMSRRIDGDVRNEIGLERRLLIVHEIGRGPGRVARVDVHEEIERWHRIADRVLPHAVRSERRAEAEEELGTLRQPQREPERKIEEVDVSGVAIEIDDVSAGDELPGGERVGRGGPNEAPSSGYGGVELTRRVGLRGVVGGRNRFRLRVRLLRRILLRP
jgi:hypothetical protein